jgi:hypothetical protein
MMNQLSVRQVRQMGELAAVYRGDLLDPAAWEALLLLVEVCNVLDLPPRVMEEIFGEGMVARIETMSGEVPARRGVALGASAGAAGSAGGGADGAARNGAAGAGARMAGAAGNGARGMGVTVRRAWVWRPGEGRPRVYEIGEGEVIRLREGEEEGELAGAKAEVR